MNKMRIEDPRFHGAGLVGALFAVCCFVAGLAIGGFVSAVLL